MKSRTGKRSVISWSGGKDSCFAMMEAEKNGYTTGVLLTVLNEEGAISRAHGIPPQVLEAQAAALGVPIRMVPSSWASYENSFTNALQELSLKWSLTHAVFGDIDLLEHRQWEEKVCGMAGLSAVLPLWKQDRKALVRQILASGLVAIIVSCNLEMGPSCLGRQLVPTLIEELEQRGIDPCGENGEFHTLVTDCALFSQPLEVSFTTPKVVEDFWYCTPVLGTGG